MRSVELSTTGWKPAFFQAASASGSPFQVKTFPCAKSAGVWYGLVEKKYTNPTSLHCRTTYPFFSIAASSLGRIFSWT